MKKTKLLTSLAALALVVSLAACETGDIYIDVGGVDIGDSSSDTTDTEPGEPDETSESTETGDTSDSTEPSGGDTTTPDPDPEPEPEPEPGPETGSWAQTLTADELSRAKTLLGCDIDDVLPYVFPDGLDYQFSITGSPQYIYIEEYAWIDIDDIETQWISALTEFGYTQNGNKYYYNDYSVQIVNSSFTGFTDFGVRLYPPQEDTGEQETTIDSWAKLLTSADYQNFAAVFGKEIESVLPFYAPKPTQDLGGYASASLSTSAQTLTLTATPTSLNDSNMSLGEVWQGWDGVLTTFGYSATHGNNEHTYLYSEFQVLITYSSSSFSFVFSKYVEPQDSDLEIAQAILDNILDKTPNWEAFYGYAEDDYFGELESYLAIDSDGNLYGYKDSDDFDEETYTYYFYKGYRCMYNVRGEAQEPKEITTTFEDELSIYTYGLTLSFDLTSDPYTLEEVDRGYELTVAKTATPYNTYTFTVDSSYNLLVIDRDTAIGSQPDYIESSYVEVVNFEDVEEALAETDFDPDDFGLGEEEETPATNPSEFLSPLKDRCNYTIQLEYDTYRSTETITYGEYQTADSATLQAIANTASLYTSYIYDLYYADDVLLIEAYQYISGYGYYYGYTEVYANDGEGGCDYYYTYDLESWSEPHHYSFEYADAFYTFTWFSENNLNNAFSYYGSGTFGGTPCTAYTYSSYYSPYLFLCLGTDAALGQSWAQTYASNFTHYLTYFFEASQEMLTNFYRATWSYTGDLTSETAIFYQEVEIYGTVYDVCNTEIPSYYY